MAEASAACIFAEEVGGPEYATPFIRASGSTGNGEDINLPGSLIGDHIFSWQSVNILTPPATPSGFTSITTATSDESGNDASIRWAVRRVLANGEGVPGPSGLSRGCAVAVADLASTFIASLTSAMWAIDLNPGVGALRIPALTVPRSMPVLAFTRKSGLTATPITGLTEILVAHPANTEVRAAWTDGNVASFAQISMSIVVSQSKIGGSILLPGRQTN